MARGSRKSPASRKRTNAGSKRPNTASQPARSEKSWQNSSGKPKHPNALPNSTVASEIVREIKKEEQSDWITSAGRIWDLIVDVAEDVAGFAPLLMALL